ncbi:hypothetical protein TNCT_26041 [Trichonephila clavata]|uniref:Uncharacterized protein n=1 Tax=Trichonephila clavata TaxID=2740835 RepID=A0A8X6LIN7_TRICU|nr:hypothetical protein TNCT_26041 [Trichonephila clavata]
MFLQDQQPCRRMNRFKGTKKSQFFPVSSTEISEFGCSSISMSGNIDRILFGVHRDEHPSFCYNSASERILSNPYYLLNHVSIAILVKHVFEARS